MPALIKIAIFVMHVGGRGPVSLTDVTTKKNSSQQTARNAAGRWPFANIQGNDELTNIKLWHTIENTLWNHTPIIK